MRDPVVLGDRWRLEVGTAIIALRHVRRYGSSPIVRRRVRFRRVAFPTVSRRNPGCAPCTPTEGADGARPRPTS